jgi:hypothetical protein
MSISRRRFLQSTAAAGFGAAGSGSTFFTDAVKAAPAKKSSGQGAVRRYHVCLSHKECKKNPDLLPIVKRAGVAEVWQVGYLYGHWYDTLDNLRAGRRQVEEAGLVWRLLNIPFGHPGNSLGDSSGNLPLISPKDWKIGTRLDGTRYRGTSWHPQATRENVEAIRQMAALDPGLLFLDDDFRIASTPGQIGGCFCDWHKKRFLEQTGFSSSQMEILLDDVKNRRLTSSLRAWVDYCCDDLTACFNAQQAAADNINVGPMVMYFGSEKAGIRLTDYKDVPFRVGELHFDDKSFDKVKGKTNELFSVLFHRRFVKPEWAYSETTAYPADALSAENIAAKMVITTIADVRNTMFMSGLTPFPIEYWETIGPKIRRQSEIHEKIANAPLCGPFKHIWGEAARYVGDDRPFSLFLASGVPFSVSENLTADGWNFLSDFDAREWSQSDARRAIDKGGRLIVREGAKQPCERAESIAESLPEMFKLKHRLVAEGYKGPYVKDDKPVVCAWYPSANAVLLWNLSEQSETIRLETGAGVVAVKIGPLDAELIVHPNLG